MKQALGLNWNILKQRFDKNFKKITVKSDFFRIYQEFLDEKENDYTGNSISNSTLKRYKCNKSLVEDFEDLVNLIFLTNQSTVVLGVMY
jgi:hypothetical protein